MWIETEHSLEWIKMKKTTLTKLLLAVLGVVATGYLAFNIIAYSEVSRQISMGQKDEQVIKQVLEVTKLVILQQQLETSSNNVTKQALSARVDTGLAKVKALRAEASPIVGESINVLLKVASKTQNEKAVYNVSLAQQVAR
jgi:cell division protein FtsB